MTRLDKIKTRNEWRRWPYGDGWIYGCGLASVWRTNRGDWIYAPRPDVAAAWGRAKTETAAKRAAMRMMKRMARKRARHP